MKKVIATIIISVILVLQTAPMVTAYDDVKIIKLTQLPSENGGYISSVWTDENGNVIEADTHLSFEPSFNTMGEGTAVPASYDARTKGVVTSVKSQGRAGNCWAFSASSVLESSVISQGLAEVGSVDFSESHLAWFGCNSATTDTNDPSYGEGETVVSPYDTGGNYQMVAQALSRWAGIATQDADPADYNDISRLPQYTDAQRRNTSSGYVIRSIKKLSSADEVKSFIMKNGSVEAAYYTTTGFYCSKSGSTAYYSDKNYTANHAITVVGWDDNYSVDNFNVDRRPTENGAWLCKNSWGKNWGDEGYFWISYYDASMVSFTAYEAKPFGEGYGNYNYNSDYASRWVLDGSMTKIANVFTAKGYEKIDSVATYNRYAGDAITFEIYTDIDPQNGSPASGKLSASFSVTFDYSGYHVVDLPEPVAVTPGSKFAVVAVVNGNWTAMEMEDEYHSNPGESYIYSRNSWLTTEAYRQGRDGIKNFYLHAFTVCDHRTVDEVKDSSCTENGTSKTVCSQCNKVFSETVLPKGDHDFTEWSITSAPTFELAGQKTRHCINCTESETVTIPAMGVNVSGDVKIDYSLNLISGINPGTQTLDSYITLAEDYEWSYETVNNRLGTGAKAIVKNGDLVVGEFTVLVYGDINGDSWYDGTDAVIVSCLVNGMLTQSNIGKAEYIAADCNRDGKIDQSDTDLIDQAGVLLANINQSHSEEFLLESSSAYGEYVLLIDQSAEIEADIPDESTTVVQNGPELSFFEKVISLIKSLLEVFLTFIPVVYG